MAKILIAGDDVTVTEALAAEIAALGHDTRVALDGREAYEYACSELPDAVFLQVSMPVFDGFETCIMLRSDPQFPTALPIFLITTDTPDPHRTEKCRVTTCLPVRHAAWQVGELLSRYLNI